MKKQKLILSVLLSLILIFPTSAFATEGENMVYTAIGDSIAFGTGASNNMGYTLMFKEHLDKVFGQVDYNPLYANGLTSQMLKSTLESHLYDLEIMESDFITISIGGNDLLQAVIEYILAHPEYMENPEILQEILQSPINEWPLDLILLSQELETNLNEFYLNYNSIMTYIRSLNPDAKIYINTVYNPFQFNETFYNFADPYFQVINEKIMEGNEIYNYRVADVYEKFNSYNNPIKLEVHETPNFTDYLHPTDIGYKQIFILHKSLWNNK